MAVSTVRTSIVSQSLAEIKSRVNAATPSTSTKPPVLVAVSKYKPESDILICYNKGHLDFGENYVQELVQKADALPSNIRWHFIGTMQSNKVKTLASIPNLHMVQTINSVKAAKALHKALPDDRTTPLNVLVQINTSGEDVKSGLSPLQPSSDVYQSNVFNLAKSIITECPNLRLVGLMTIGSLERSSKASESGRNADFQRLMQTRDLLQQLLSSQLGDEAKKKWGTQQGILSLSMGMTNDFEAALKAGSNIVRVGTGIFGEREKTT